MMRDMSENRGLADTGLADHLNRQSSIQRRERRGQFHPAIEQPPSRLRTKNNWRRPGVYLRLLDLRGFADQGAARITNLDDIASDGDLTRN